MLYSIAFWLFKISPDAKFGGILEGERGRKERREGKGRERERELTHTCGIILKNITIIKSNKPMQCNEVSEFILLSHTSVPSQSVSAESANSSWSHLHQPPNTLSYVADSTLNDSCHHYTPPHTIGGWDSHHGNMV